MPLATIKSTTAAVSVMINSNEYAARMDTAEFRSDAPIENETVFANEAAGGAFSVGTEVMRLTFGGPLKNDDVHTVPFLPLSSFKDKTWSIAYNTSCSASGTCSFYSSAPDNRAGTTRRFRSEAINTGTFVIAWDETVT